MSGNTPEPNMPPTGQPGTQQSARPGDAGYPQGGYPQGGQQGGYPQGGQQGGYPQGAPPPGAAPPQGNPPQGGYPPPGYPPPGYQQGGYQQGGYPQGGYPPPGYPQGGYPPGGYPPGGAPPQGWTSGYAAVSEMATRVTGRRVMQFIVDAILAGIVPGLAYWLLDRGSLHAVGWLLATVIALAVYFWYWVLWPHGHGGQTFGMQLFGLRVISKHGGPASMSQLLVRTILLIVDVFFYGLVGWLTMMFSRYRQRVGDHAAGTLVIPADLPPGG